MRQGIPAELHFDVSVVTVIKDQLFEPIFPGFAFNLSNHNGWPFPPNTRKRFEEFVRDGRGFVVVHAVNAAFPNWPEYNLLIGLAERNGCHRGSHHSGYV